MISVDLFALPTSTESMHWSETWGAYFPRLVFDVKRRTLVAAATASGTVITDLVRAARAGARTHVRAQAAVARAYFGSAPAMCEIPGCYVGGAMNNIRTCVMLPFAAVGDAPSVTWLDDGKHDYSFYVRGGDLPRDEVRLDQVALSTNVTFCTRATARCTCFSVECYQVVYADSCVADLTDVDIMLLEIAQVMNVRNKAAVAAYASFSAPRLQLELARVVRSRNKEFSA